MRKYHCKSKVKWYTLELSRQLHGFMAMAEKTKKRIINLIPNKNESVFVTFLAWALTVGRLLIIITETLALTVFLFRFILDVQIIDLHDKIKAQSLIIQSFQKAEDQFRNFQFRLTLAKEYDSKKDVSLSLLQTLINLGKNKITFQNILVTVDAMKIEAQASSATTLNTFVKSLKDIPEVRDVSIDRVESSPSTGIVTLSLTISLKDNLQKTSIPTNVEELEFEK